MKMAFVLIALACSTIEVFGQERVKDISTENTLSSFSIDLKAIPPRTSKWISPTWTSPGEIICQDQKQDAYTGLKAVGKPNYIAVIKSNPCSPTILNPEGYDYGPIPALTKITSREADELFGKPIIQADQRSYKLLSATDSEYFIDFCFDGEKVKKYRVRGQNLRGEPVWCCP